MFSTPILFVIFNRPKVTEITFSRIRELKPKYLFIAADGPRLNETDDIEKCRLTRRIVMQMIDWECEVKTRFEETNQGAGSGPFNAITWFFQNVEQGIILEDDCLPSLSFFTFTSHLLAAYQLDEKIFQINGNLTVANSLQKEHTYFYSNYPNIWGWASWRRAWNLVKREIEISEIDNAVNATSLSQSEKNYWINYFKTIHQEKFWDAQLLFTHFKFQKLSIFPTSNLILNVGFEAGATHTNVEPVFHSHLQLNEISEFIGPTQKSADLLFDRRHFLITQQNKTLYSKFRNIGTSLIRKVVSSLGIRITLKSKTESKKDKLIRIFGKMIRANFDHRLDEFAKDYPNYDSFLPALTRTLDRRRGSLTVLDVGANIGDTAIALAYATTCSIISFEGDSFYYNYLEQNTRGVDRIKRLKLLLGDESKFIGVRSEVSKGTAKLVNTKDGEIKEIHSLDNLVSTGVLTLETSDVILKIDTDGFDLKILKGASALIRKYKPILFFEMDVQLVDNANAELQDLIFSLNDMAYSVVYVFDNFGNYLCKLKLTDPSLTEIIFYPKRSTNIIYHFDLCVVPNNTQLIDIVDETVVLYK
jgi:FkbM family methyltransferase